MAENTSFFAKLSRKAQIAFICTGLLLIIGCCAAAVGLYAHFTKTEGIYETTTAPDLSVDAALSEKSAAVAQINKLLDDASDSKKTKTTKKTELSVGNINIENGSEAEHNVVSFTVNGMLGEMKKLYGEHKGVFGDGFDGLPEVILTEADISDIYAQVGKYNNNQELEQTDKLFIGLSTVGGAYPDFITDGIGKTFSCSETENMLSEINKAFSDTAEIKQLNLKSDGFNFDCVSDKLTGRISSATVSRHYKAEMEIEFTGGYSAFGTKNISLDFSCVQSYVFEWAGVSFAKKTVNISPKSSEMLTVNAVLEKEAAADDFEITFTRSDESIATVDNDGIVTGKKLSEEPAVITVTFEYLGNVYTDTCEVFVVNEVEKITVSPQTLSLGIGKSAALTYQLKPDDATLTSVKWYTEDEGIATVDENGVVTATGAGETKVFAVSDDGHFRASCVVTVTQGGAANG